MIFCLRISATRYFCVGDGGSYTAYIGPVDIVSASLRGFAAMIVDATKVPIGSTSSRAVKGIDYPPRAKVPQEVLDRLDVSKLVRELKKL